MFAIIKNEKDDFISAKSKVKVQKIAGAWNDKNIAKIRAKLRKYILSHEQNFLCAYCEKSITEDSHKSNIDHFKTRNLFPEKTLEYENLLVSCNTNHRCSTYKDKNIKNKNDYLKMVNPINDNPDDYFDYMITGEIIAKNEKAKFTIDIFQLGKRQDEPLSRQRKELAEALQYSQNLSLDEIYKTFGYEFKSFIKIIYTKLQGVTT